MQRPITSRRACADGLGRGLLVAGADRGEALGDAVGGGDQEVAGARGRVEDLQVEDRPLRVLRSCAAASSSTGSSAESSRTLISEVGV